MKIVNQETGESYQLNAGTRLEVERPNLFFSEYDEQSLPVEMPDTAKNRRMMGYPDQVANVRRPRTDIPCLIEDGGFVKPCRQAVIAAQRHASITSSFYFDENALMGKMKKVRLKDVFGMETIPGITTVDEGIAFCTELIKNQHPDYTIFQVALEETGQNFYGHPTHKFINLYGCMNYDTRNDQSWFESGTSKKSSSYSYYNAVERIEEVNGRTIHVGKGYYISPFMRANYLLKRMFAYWGYAVGDNLFTQNEGFCNMAIVNRCADAIVNGSIYLCDLVPDCTCYELLEAYRKYFMCQFEIDEQQNIVTPVFFKDLLERTPRFDLTPLISGRATVESPEAYKRLVLTPASSEVSNLAGDRDLKQGEVRKKYPSAQYSNYLGLYFRQSFHFSYNSVGGGCSYKQYVEYIKDASTVYDYGGPLGDESVSIPIHMPAMTGSGFGPKKQAHLLVGKPVFINSKIVFDEYESEDAGESSGDTQADANEQPIIFAYRVKQGADYYGLSAVGCLHYVSSVYLVNQGRAFYELPESERYDLSLSGDYSIYERFYRIYDHLLRNSLWYVHVNLRVNDQLRNSLLSYEPVFFDGQKFLLDTFRYVVGGEEEPSETALRTVQLYEPLDTPPISEDEFSYDQRYYWYPRSESVKVSREEYESSPYRDKAIPTVYPALPSSELDDGKRHYERTTVRGLEQDNGFARMTVWLECKPVGQG